MVYWQKLPATKKTEKRSHMEIYVHSVPYINKYKCIQCQVLWRLSSKAFTYGIRFQIAIFMPSDSDLNQGSNEPLAMNDVRVPQFLLNLCAHTSTVLHKKQLPTHTHTLTHTSTLTENATEQTHPSECVNFKASIVAFEQIQFFIQFLVLFFFFSFCSFFAIWHLCLSRMSRKYFQVYFCTFFQMNNFNGKKIKIN